MSFQTKVDYFGNIDDKNSYIANLIIQETIHSHIYLNKLGRAPHDFHLPSIKLISFVNKKLYIKIKVTAETI